MYREGNSIKKLKQGHAIEQLGNMNSSIEEVLLKTTKFIGACYESKEKDSMSEITN